jgi:hypothetical protein
LVVADKLSKKYGDVAYTAQGKNPRFLEIERLLPTLTEEQFQIVLGVVEGIARRNRVKTAHTANASAPTKGQMHPAKAKCRSLKNKQSKPEATYIKAVKLHEVAEVKR